MRGARRQHARPLSTLGLVSNVVQLVSFTADILIETDRYVKSSSKVLPSCEDIAQLVERQQASYSNIKSIETRLGPLDQAEASVKSLGEKCTAEAHQLICLLEGLTSKTERSGKRKFCAGLVAVTRAKWRRGDIEQALQSLAKYENHLSLALTSLIRCARPLFSVHYV